MYAWLVNATGQAIDPPMRSATSAIAILQFNSLPQNASNRKTISRFRFIPFWSEKTEKNEHLFNIFDTKS